MSRSAYLQVESVKCVSQCDERAVVRGGETVQQSADLAGRSRSALLEIDGQIVPNYDATITPRLMTSRGLQLQPQYTPIV